MISFRTLRPALGLLVVVALSLVASADSAAMPCPDCPPVPAPLALSCPTENPLSSLLPPKEEGTTPVAAGKIPDGFSVSSRGEAIYSLTLDVPPGRQGMEPHLSLSYSSSSGEGPYGMGFALSGLSSVTRCPSDIAHDKRIRGVRYDREDNFCLDGLRLVQVGGGSVHTVLGAYSREYRTFPDTFRRVRAYSADEDSSPQVFVAETKSGRVVRYGEPATFGFNGRVMGKDGVVRSWAVTRETDRHDNGIDYIYQNDREVSVPGGPTGDGHTITHVPLRINYTAHYTKPTTAPTYAVVFGWSDITHHATAFTGGTRINSGKRLHQVQMLGPSDVAVRTYYFTRGSGSSVRTRIEDIVECAGASLTDCRPSTKLDWLEQPGSGFTEIDTGIAYPTHPPGHEYTHTPNNETDVYEGTTTIGYPAHELDPAYKWLMADVTGDGLSDLVVSQAHMIGCTLVPGIPTDTLDCENNLQAEMDISLFGHGQYAVNNWNVAKNLGGTLSGLTTWRQMALPVQFEKGEYASFSHQAYNIVPADMNQDGKTDILYHDSGRNGQIADIKVLTNPAPINATAFVDGPSSALAVSSSVAGQQYSNSGVLYADMNGDGVLDAITCEDGLPIGTNQNTTGTWRLNLWNPVSKNFAADPQDPQASIIPIDSQRGCYLRSYIHVVDVDGDGKAELLIPPFGYAREESKPPDGHSGTLPPQCAAPCEYQAIQRDHASPGGALVSWRQYNTKLPAPNWYLGSGRVLFLDVNGDGLPDALESRADVQNRFWTFLNTGNGFNTIGTPSLSLGQPATQAAYLDYAATIDYNGDGQTDVLLPMKNSLCNLYQMEKCWVIMQSDPVGEGHFSTVPLNILLTDEIDAIIGLSEPSVGPNNENYKVFLQTLIPRVADLNGDGRQDVVIPISGTFKLFINEGPQDLLHQVTDGMNPLDHAVFPLPADPGFVPNIKIQYGSLVDHASTVGFAQDSSQAEDDTYLPRSDTPQPLSDCDYPRTCVVGPRRVVSSYELNNGQNKLRKFTMRYRNGRSHRLGRGFLGFGSVSTTDEDAHTGHAELYDNVSEDDTLLNKADPAHPFPITTFPFAGNVAQSWSWVLGLPGDESPLTRMRLVNHKRSLAPTGGVNPTNSIVPTNGDVTYFTLAKETVTREHEASYATSPLADANKPVPPFVRSWAESNLVVDNLRKTTHTITDHDTFGNILKESDTTHDVDDTRSADRTVTNDEVNWLLGEVTNQTVCSKVSALGSSSQCRVTDRTYVNGDVESETTRGGDLGSVLLVQATTTYIQDAFGNVTNVSAYDHVDGQRRASCVGYDSDGIFPYVFGNGAEHFTFVAYDKELSVPFAVRDPNGLETKWKHDAFGRTTREARPDGTTTLYKLQRLRSGGPDGQWWALHAGATAPMLGASGVELDSLGRTVRSLTKGPAVSTCGDSGACSAGPIGQIEQIISYDFLGRVTSRSKPYVQGDPSGATFFTTYEYDNSGRVLSVKTPWNAATEYTYTGNMVRVTAPGTSSFTTNDPWGRPTRIEDALGRETAYEYAYFGGLHKVTLPGNNTITTKRDAFGRVTEETDPDRGVTAIGYDGFGQRMSVNDAQHLTESYDYDVLGRMIVKTDEVGQTLWHYDDPLKGLGRLSDVVNPAGITRSYTYKALGQNGVGQVQSVQLTAGADSLTTTLAYDAHGRLSTVAYPPSFGQDFRVRREYDDFGYLLRVKDDVNPTSAPYWELKQVNSVGQTTEEQMNGGTLVTTRSYSPEKGTLEHILTMANVAPAAPKKVQDLGYTYDARLNLERRVDGLQIVSGAARGESFTHDALDRLQCSRLDAACSVLPGATCPCDQSVTYQPNGNIDTKSDVGAYTYDPAHPHAVKTTTTGSGVDTYGYDSVGNQTDRPDLTVEYTPFDLPSKYTRKDGGTVTLLEYDGDQTRMRKTTPTEETLYFGDYERLTHLPASTSVEHRYSVRSDERVVATVERTTQRPTDLASYLHVDHLGSIETVTSWSGVVAEKRSYDAFGAKRGADWTKTTPPSTSSTTLGYTGHEDDEGLGLVNMKGRIYDPRLARFLTTDPLVSYPTFSQSWNPYSYVMNSPLKFVDPSGFAVEVKPDGSYEFARNDPADVIRVPVERDPMSVPRGRDSDTLNREVGNKDAGAPQADNDASTSHIIAVYAKTVAMDYAAGVAGTAVETGATVATFGLWIGGKAIYRVLKGAVSGGASGALRAYGEGLPVVSELLSINDTLASQTWATSSPDDKATTLGHLTLPAVSLGVTVAGVARGLVKGSLAKPGLEGDPWSPRMVLERQGTLAQPNGPLAAQALGYGQRIPTQKAPFPSHGAEVYSNGKNYITPDVDVHSGGVWKMFDRRGNRLGTYDADLNRMKD